MNEFRLPGGPKTIKYEVVFHISERGRQENRTVTVDVNDTGNERMNTADAILEASLDLDKAGIKHWILNIVAEKGATSIYWA